MKLLFSEYKSDYGKYYFPYQVYAKIEETDDLDKVFEMGFLPTRISPDLFYLTRSIRVDSKKFDMSSENRRILKKTENFGYKVVSLSDFEYTYEVQKNCKLWLNSRFGHKIISAQGVKKVFNGERNNTVFVWSLGDRVVGYTPSIVHTNFLFYNYAFYDPEFYKQSLGARMMLQSVIYSVENKLKYIYLGSVYTKGSMYKTEFSGVEFFSGISWSDKIADLKYLVTDKQWEGDHLIHDSDFLQSSNGTDKIEDLLQTI